ncbi:MAG: NAD-dependent epimerase/dehydratase family protein [Porticoccaceae bacterium]|nr:NAD-dependent epimerase/dehydratase family protein [Pseudomonadales bacterium]MCP5172873.1 NAD-dependent epimerase/dehydratase family protein [Pseudomonadales bacterium]MCP5302347.1 NAD-dependent epimerase/dehydratase family protein [Pseudomonadales bacterium]
MANQLKTLFLACGDIGSRAIQQMNPDCWNVAAMRRRAECLPEVASAFSGDLCDKALLKKVLCESRPDAVVVTLTPAAMSDEGYRASYVAGAESLCGALTSLSMSPLVIWVSSTGVYGQQNGEWVDEDAVTEPQNYRGQRLLEAERVMHDSGLPVCVVRFSGIYGPGRERLMNNVRAGKLPSAEEPLWTNRIHSEDCAGVLVHLLERFRLGETLDDCYLATDNEPTVAHVMQRELARLMAGEAPAGLDALSDLPGNTLIKGRRCSNQKLCDSGYLFRYPTWKEGYGAVLAAMKAAD